MEDEGCKRKRTGTIVSRCNHDPQGEKKHISATPHDETETIAANLNFKVGDEVFFKGKIKDSEGFSGEILSVNAIDDNGRYRLGMVILLMFMIVFSTLLNCSFITKILNYTHILRCLINKGESMLGAVG